MSIGKSKYLMKGNHGLNIEERCWNAGGRKSMIDNSQKYKKIPKVFLSHSFKDDKIAKIIEERLQNENIYISSNLLLDVKDHESMKSINDAISASDYVIALLSENSINSNWVDLELDMALTRELISRDITILPVLIGDCRIPANLSKRQFIDLRFNFDKGINKLIEQLKLIPDIDFSMLSQDEFRYLIIDLLKHLGFRNIENNFQIDGKIFDLKAIFSRIDPFGANISETWLIELKFYKDSRANLKSIHQFTNYLMHLPENYKGLLITNSMITSASRDWLENNRKISRIDIKIIDITELKRLLIKNKNLVDKYFKTVR